MNSNETHKGIFTHCEFVSESKNTKECFDFRSKAADEIGNIDIDNIYAPICINPTFQNGSIGSVSLSQLYYYLQIDQNLS